jgi:hydroxymethylpyrimidine pyrophosphatase-like HAD family hydrolase
MAVAHPAQGVGVPGRVSRPAPKLLAVDLDGTLLDTKGQPHLRDVRAIRAAVVAGVRVSIVTGRLYSGTRAFVEQLGLNGAIACADGSHIVHASDHATLLHLGVRDADARTLRSSFQRASVATFVFARDAIGHDAAGVPFVDYVSTWSNDVRVAADVFQHDLWDADEGVTAVLAVGTRDQIVAVADDVGRRLPDAVMVAAFPMRRDPHAGQWAMIVRNARTTKGTAMRWIAAHEGLALEETVCVGDWINDVPMFDVAGRSFVMGQAPDEVKARATDVLEHTHEDGGGVAHALREAFGIEAG